MEIMILENGKVIMTSREIAELTGKNHADVMRDIRDESTKLGEEVARSIFALGEYKDKNRQSRGEYILTKDGVMQIGARYDAKIRYKLIQRLKELEIEKPKLLTINELLEQSSQMIKNLENKIIEDKPRVSFAETIEKSSDCILIREFSKILGNEGIKLGEKKLYAWLRNKGYIQKNSTEPTQRAMEQELFKMYERTIKTIKGDIISITTKLTGKGQLFLLEKLKLEVL